MQFQILSLFALFAAAIAQQGSSGDNAFKIPPGGISFTAGQPATISWTPSTEGTVTLILREGAASALNPGTVIKSGIPNNGQFTFTPDANIVRGTDYALEIISDSDPSKKNFTPQFVIESKNTVVSITPSSIASTAAATTTAVVSSTKATTAATTLATSASSAISASSASSATSATSATSASSASSAKSASSVSSATSASAASSATSASSVSSASSATTASRTSVSSATAASSSASSASNTSAASATSSSSAASSSVSRAGATSASVTAAPSSGSDATTISRQGSFAGVAVILGLVAFW